MGWKTPSSLLLFFLLQKQQSWNSGFVAINGTHAIICEGRFSPCQAILCKVNVSSLAIHPSEDRAVHVQKTVPKGGRGKFWKCPQRVGFPSPGIPWTCVSSSLFLFHPHTPLLTSRDNLAQLESHGLVGSIHILLLRFLLLSLDWCSHRKIQIDP